MSEQEKLEALLERYEERAAILEYEANYSRPEAERLARLAYGLASR
jgi:hypothetical protein